MMLRTLINLRTLVVLAQFDLDLSVRSARRIILALAALVLGGSLALVPYLHNLGGPGPIYVGTQRADRVVVTLAVLWVALGVIAYSKTRSWISEYERSASSYEEFGLRTMLGSDVLSSAIVERLASIFFSVIFLAILSIAAIVHTSIVSVAVILVGGGLGFSLHCQAGLETLLHLARPEQKIRYFSILRLLVPLCLALVVVTGIRGWQNIGNEIHVSNDLVIAACCISMLFSMGELICFTKTIHDIGAHPIGLPLTRIAFPVAVVKHGFFSQWMRTIVRLFALRPLLSGLMVTRWPLALILVLSVVDVPHIKQNAAWIVAFIFISTLDSVSSEPDLLLSGRILRFYYEERGSFPTIFAISLLTRILVILPQVGVMIILWRLVGGRGFLYVIALALLAVISDVFATGLAGSSHQQASQYSLAMAGLVTLIVTAAGTAFLGVAPVATAFLSISVLILAYITWRKNVAYIT